MSPHRKRTQADHDHGGHDLRLGHGGHAPLTGAVSDEDRAFMKTLLDEYGALGRFSHREHLHMTWSYIRWKGMPDAGDYIVRFIKHVAAHHGGGDLYNETMTRFFIYAMAWAIANAEDRDDFETLLAANPHLTDKRLAERHWSSELLTSPVAKAEWVEPDLKPIPAVPIIAPMGVV